MTSLPPWPADPFSLVPEPGFEPRARRQLELAGVEVELLWLPERAARGGRPGADRPPFLPSPVARILREETVFERGRIAVTQNKFPFASRHLVLWHRELVREADRALLEAVFSLADQVSGTSILNSIGAAASIPRAHAHVLGDRSPFLEAFGRSPFERDLGLGDHGSRLSRLEAFPAECLVVEGDLEARIRGVHELLHTRMTTAFNLVGMGDSVFVFPRSTVEIPAPDFPQALGSAELWGRWCFHDREAFESATGESLARALRTAGHAPGSAG